MWRTAPRCAPLTARLLLEPGRVTCDRGRSWNHRGCAALVELRGSLTVRFGLGNRHRPGGDLLSTLHDDGMGRDAWVPTRRRQGLPAATRGTSSVADKHRTCG